MTQRSTPRPVRARVAAAAVALLAVVTACAPARTPAAEVAAAPAVAPSTTVTATAAAAPRWGIAIHGGAGVIRRETLSPEREAEYRAKLAEALTAGHTVLARGGTSLDAVEAAIRILEDSPLFNAGRGAVFTAAGTNELDAAVMDGRTLGAGAVAGLTHVKNPITLARAVMEHSPHVMMIGAGAEQFARERRVELVAPEYFRTEGRWRALQRIQEEERARAAGDTARTQALLREAGPDDRKFGTVGAVALDRYGNLAAGTSTGGMTNKRWGRVGDVPIIGAGTYASNASCAVSATGHGEFFIRNTVARDICALVEYRGMSLEAAGDEVVMRRLVQQGGEGGVIAMDPQGNVAMPFNSPGMYRGLVGPDGRPEVAIFRD